LGNKLRILVVAFKPSNEKWNDKNEDKWNHREANCETVRWSGRLINLHPESLMLV